MAPEYTIPVRACLLLMVMALTTLPGVSAESLITLPLAASSVSDAKNAEEAEYGIKAAFIYNFMRFIEWPEDKLKAKRQRQQENVPSSAGDDSISPPPILIGILGKNPFRQAFSPILGKKIGDRAIELVLFEGFEPYLRAGRNETEALAAYRKKNGQILARCDVLFICASEAGHLDSLLPLTEGSYAVTVSDIPEFVQRGGMIGFVTENNKVRFDIHLEPVEREKIKIRSQLLELARQIHKKPDAKR